MANTVTQPSKTEKRLKALFCIFAVVAVIVSGTIIALNIIVSGDNMVNIVEQYLVKSDPLPEPGAQTGENSGSETGEDSPTGLFAIYGMLDGGDYNQIAAGISDGTLLDKLGGAEGIEKFTDIADSGGSIFDKIAGFSSIFSGFGSIGKVLSGEYNVVRLLLNVVDANDLIRPNTVAAAMEDAGLELPELPESQEEPASEGEDLSGEEPETSEETDISGEEELPGEAASAEAQPEDEGAQTEGAEEESAVQGVDITSAIEAALSRAENPVSGEENAETQSAAEESGENSAEEPAQEQPSEEEQTDNLYIRAFMHTKLMSEITIDSAFVYFDYYSNVKTGETWKETLKEKIL